MSGNAHQRRCARRAKQRADARWEVLCEQFHFLRSPFFSLVHRTSRIKGKRLPIPVVYEEPA